MALKSYSMLGKRSKRKKVRRRDGRLSGRGLFGVGIGLVGLSIGLSAVKSVNS